MALTPIDLPGSPAGDGIASHAFAIVRVDYASPDASARFGGVTAGWPLWKMTAQVGPLAVEDQARDWGAFLDKLRGQQGTFYGRHLNRSYPRNYPSGFSGLNRAGGGAFPATGAATSWSVNADRDRLTLNGLPAAFVLSLDDHIGFSWTTSSEPRRALVKVVGPITANGSGVAASIPIEPPLHNVVPGGATAYLEKPTCLMRQIVQPGESPLGAEDTTSMEGFTFTALQDLRE